MKWFKRKKSKGAENALDVSRQQPQHFTPRVSDPRYLAYLQAAVPIIVWERIWSFVCPHTLDEGYENCEQSSLDGSGTCMLCDLRDLSHCAQVSKKWNTLVVKVMYHSVRIDPVHYCDLEDILAERRKRRSRYDRNGEPEDTAKARLTLLCRTLRDRAGVRDAAGDYGAKVRYFKIPYMTRETCKTIMAQTVAVMPNLRYLDLPEGIFSEDSSCITLKEILQARCTDLRKMTYTRGSERDLESLASGRFWHNLEVLELSKIVMDPMILRHALGALYNLRALKVSHMKSFNDDLFQHNDRLPPFPPLRELIFNNVPNITAQGIATYLQLSGDQNTTETALEVLSMTNTGVLPSELQHILATAHSLKYLTIITTVSTSFPASSNILPLSSSSLQTLNYEISAADTPHTYASTTEGYYAFLKASLISNKLPNLQELYVRDPDFPEALLDLAPPAPAFASDPDNFRPRSSGGGSGGGGPFLSPLGSPRSTHSHSSTNSMPNNRFSSNNPFANAARMQSAPGLKQELIVYSKGLDEEEWSFSNVKPAEKGRRGSATAPRPISSYGLGNGLASPWASERGARQSVVVGNGFGGFLAVPNENGPRPSSSAGEKGHRRKGSQYDMWR